MYKFTYKEMGPLEEGMKMLGEVLNIYIATVLRLMLF